MSYCRQIELPTAEPVSLASMRQWMRIPSALTSDDTTISTLLKAARESAETITGRAIAQRKFCMVLDAFPYNPDSNWERSNFHDYNRGLFSRSREIKLPFPPGISVDPIQVVASDGTITSLTQGTNFILDRISEPARITPLPGSDWPASLYVANAVKIPFTAGYDPDPTVVSTSTIAGSTPSQQPVSTVVTGIPATLAVAIMQLANFWYENRGIEGQVPKHIEQALWSQAVIDFNPTR
ncbi:MAG: hypothetical protein JWN34_2028 [Bryobacterales bacterium]|nr:hypothetical protein [Bryobacterales bacterium]